MNLSVVMLVRDRLNLTRQSLTSLVAHTSAPLTITIVDDQSKPETRDWLAEWIDTVAVKTLLIRNNESHGTGAARNQGIQFARESFGDKSLLYLTDNDTYFLPHWDEVLLEAYVLSKYKILGGGCHPYLQPNGWGPNFFVTGMGAFKVASRDAVSGYSWLLDWATWDEFGPLDAHALGVRQSEDWAMCQKVIAAGGKVGSVVPEVVLHTGLHDTFDERPPGWELIQQNMQRGVIYE